MAKYTKRGLVRSWVKQYEVEYTKAMGDYVADLAVLGYEAIMYAYQRREFTHRTRNLHDSYGSAVYVNGKLEPTSRRFVGPEYSTENDRHTGKSGRDTLLAYFDNPGVDVSGDIVLLCVAAMEYAEYLEDGTHGGGYEIQVISAANDYLQQNWHRISKNKPKEFEIIRARVITGGDSYS